MAALASGNDGTWALPIGALVICLRHVGLCGYDPQECMAIEHELAAWQRLGGLMHHDEALRLRATLQRALRLADGYCQALLDSLTQPAATLGAALGVEAERAAVFVESEVRSNVVFQLSKLASLLLKATGEVAGITPWDVVVGGNATGVILQVSTLEPGCLDAAGDGDAILLVDSATGDEEIGPLGSRLKGIILKHEVPHLSHLGVRARQEKVPFVTCEDSDLVESVVGPLKGRWATLTAQPDGVSVVAAAGGAGQKAVRASSNGAANGNGTQPAPVIATSDIVRVKKLEFVTLEEAGQESCGAKAASCGRLLHLAAECAAALEVSGRSDGAPIMEALHGVVLPFGCMEAALEADGKTAAFNAAVARAEDAARTACSTTAIAPPEALQQLDAACAELVDLVAGVRIPQAFLQILGGCFDPGSIVIARSSANVEDLQGMSGAGLYESVPNLDPKDPAALQRGIAATWASLFTRRALLARAAAGVPPGSAAMAVVVQRQLAPELSFVLHTVHPVTNDPDTLVAEIAPGLGETLASGTKGSAWRLEVDKPTGNVKTLAFANFSKALLPGGVRSTISKAGTAVAAGAQEGDVSRDDVAAVPVAESEPVSCTVTPRTMDYSTQEMSWSGDMRAALGRRLAAVGVLLENEFGGAQDVEGCVVQGHLCVVQSRPQP